MSEFPLRRCNSEVMYRIFHARRSERLIASSRADVERIPSSRASPVWGGVCSLHLGVDSVVVDCPPV